MPFRAVKQIWNSTRGVGLEAAVPDFFILWWAAWIVSEIIGNISFRIADDPGIYMSAVWMDVISAPLTTVSAVIWVRILRRVAEAQGDMAQTAKVFE